MTGSMYAAIAGLRTHMQNLNVIGHNIANVNTNGYKSSRALFKTAIYSTLTGGSNGTDTVGGRNPSQIGYGANVASVDIDMSTGNYAVTGKSTDLMLDGDGFFLVGDKTIANNFDGTAEDVNRLSSLMLTRVGNFEFKADGYFCNGDSQTVYGFLCTGIATQEDVVAGRAKKVGDALFSDQLVPIRAPRVSTTTEYYTIDENGNEVTDGITAETPGALSRVITHIEYPRVGEEGGRLVDAMGPVDEETGVATELPYAQLTGITVDGTTGLITGTADNGEDVVIGCIAVGQVTNPNGVTSLGNNYYKAGAGSGQLSINLLGGQADNCRISYVNASLAAGNEDAEDTAPIDRLRIGGGGKTSIMASGLEMSKTDLAQEIANMILTQRGYQANTRIVTVTDSMLEELVNMKR